jgi:hypothetical protein
VQPGAFLGQRVHWASAGLAVFAVVDLFTEHPAGGLELAKGAVGVQ